MGRTIRSTIRTVTPSEHRPSSYLNNTISPPIDMKMKQEDRAYSLDQVTPTSVGGKNEKMGSVHQQYQ
jgi:hypothetical protein